LATENKEKVNRMVSFPFLRTTACTLAVSVSLWTCGCVATKYVATDDIGGCQEKPVKILTPGGSEYRLQTWSIMDSSIVTSEGEVHHSSMKPGFWGTRFEQFSGTLPVDSVKQCFCEETDVAYTIVGYTLLGILVLVPLLLLVTGFGGAPQGGSWGK
jgi:hypothetical protein